MSGLRLALIGYGEVGQVLAVDLVARGIECIAVWDKLFVDPASAPALAIRATPHVREATGMRDALRDRELVISAVTAGECLSAAREAAPWLRRGAHYFDLNSVAPATKAQSAQAIEAAGGIYVEAAVMSPIAEKRSASPMLLGGRHAADFATSARELGFTGVEAFSDRIGGASAAKMCRSVMIKGLEALLAESMLAARHYGVEASVLSSLQNLFPADWPGLARYMIGRSVQHGRRRAEEMREVALTVRGAGVEPWMSVACAERQDWAAAYAPALETNGLEEMLDAVRAMASHAAGEHS